MTIVPYGKSFDFYSFMQVMESSFKNYKVPIVTLIAMQDHDPFKILISTILSARTKDETTAAASKRLFDIAPTPQILSELPVKKIEELIYPVGFYKTKALRIKETANILIKNYNGKVPDSIEKLLEFPGVGRKTANLVLEEAFKKEAICVDIHVHRISNRLGIIKTKTPLDTEKDLEKIMPKRYWITYNTFLVAHGQSVCNPISPKCSVCSVSKFCRKINVKKSR